jgi:uncharacterized membrane protein
VWHAEGVQKRRKKMRSVSKRIYACVTVTGFALSLVVAARAAAHSREVESPDVTISLGTITPINVPGATGTLASDINASGFIVGRYASAGRTHGFLRTPEGDYFTIDFPGSSFTVAAAINDHGDIAGQYTFSTAPSERHGFLLQDGNFTSFDPTGSIYTNALGINERGDVVGRYCTVSPCAVAGNGSFRGFLLHDGEITNIDVPGALETDAFKINGRGQIVGGFLTSDHKEEFFVLSHGEFTAFASPDGKPFSLDSGGIDERDGLVGVYCDSALPCSIVPTGTHGFLIRGDNFIPIDVPGAKATATLGINARGEIVGQYNDATGGHGFLLSPYQPSK